MAEAKVDQIAGGSLYSYTLPDQWGVDKKIVPNAGLSNNVAVISLSTAQTDRLLKETPLTVAACWPIPTVLWRSPVGSIGKRLSARPLLGSITSWIRYRAANGGQKDMVVSQAHTLLEVLSDDQEHYQRNVYSRQHHREPLAGRDPDLDNGK